MRILEIRIPNTESCLPCGRAARCRLTGVLGSSLSRTPGVLSARLAPVEEPVSCRCRDAVRWLPLSAPAVATLLLNPRVIMPSCFLSLTTNGLRAIRAITNVGHKSDNFKVPILRLNTFCQVPVQTLKQGELLGPEHNISTKKYDCCNSMKT
jgi:hypothetical protein